MLTGVRTTRSHGFALPTILIASIVMMIVLLVSVSSGASVRNAILNQYYTQLAQVAGEAGVEYAKACLAQNDGVPQWSDANPLKPNTNCAGSPVVACPTTAADSRCAVSIDGNVRSSFSVGMPTLNADGKASLVPQTGYVEVLRTSNNAVWRTYRQPSVQAAVVPDLCSGRATSQLGWTNATSRTSSYGPTPATPISTSTTNINPGPMYFRKDFSIPKGGNFYFDIYANDIAEVYIDGEFLTKYDRAVSGTSTVRTPTSLSVGCHSIVVKLTNTEILVNSSVLVAMLIKQGSSSPTVVTDSTWRVTAGPQRHYSEVGYYADPSSWTSVRDRGAVSAYDSSWDSVTGDLGARFISTTHSYDGSGYYPSNQLTIFRDERTIKLDAPVTARITIGCDDSCYPYMDGNLIHNGSNSQFTFTVDMSEGEHKFGMLLTNGTGPAGFGFTARDVDSGSVITHSDDNWTAANFWSATNPTNSFSYDTNYTINPDPLPTASVQALVVGGGGGGGDFGGGGGAGGVVYEGDHAIGIGTYPITVGAGGAGENVYGSGLPGDNGRSSRFDSIIAVGGGGGGSRYSDYTSRSGAVGGSGGGSSMGNTGTSAPRAPGIYGQGTSGGLGRVPNNPHLHGGGGGANVPGGDAIAPYAGNGGNGLAYSITGSSVYYGGGGGGGTYTDGTYVVGSGGAGGGGAGTSVPSGPGGNGVANTGGGGGGGGANGTGGTGGSGIVVIRYVTGSIVATGGAISYSGDFTIHRFTSSGTFNVTKVNDPTQADVARGTTLVPNYSEYNLVNGATYSSSTARLAPGSNGYAYSPLILVNKPTSIIVGGDFYANVASTYPTLAPRGGYHVGVQYYGADGVTLVQNSAGSTSNGCAHSLTLGVWTLNTQMCNFQGGPNVIYIKHYVYGAAQSYSSSDLLATKPLVITN